MTINLDHWICQGLFFFALLLPIYAVPTTPKLRPPKVKCGYESCHPVKDGFINVHIVPHTHDDVGWLKTVDQYYYGANSQNQLAGVQYILDTVIRSLNEDPNRRFIYVETAFFWRWWIKQHDTVKSVVRNLVNNGQLEFISGGWSMNDEAATNYQSIIDQMTWGLRKLNDTFGECGHPKIGWQIDPFGHSREMASIFAGLGFDGLLFGRIDYQEKQYRMETKTAEMVWRGSDSLGEVSDLFTSVMYNTYSPPPGFCFDILCSDEPIIDDKKSFEYNVDNRVDEFLNYIGNVSNVYATKNIIITMGEDFNYQSADSWFVNLDKLITYVNQRQENGSTFNLIYSTPSCYVKAVHDEANGTIDWLLKQDDFFPYASDPHAFWTGYFTSRPTLKRFERLGNNFLQVCKQLYALTDLGPEDMVDLDAMRDSMGVMQHHDAITGTEKQHVASDYARRLQRGIDECEIITNEALNKLVAPSSTQEKISFTTCPLLNISQCEFTESQDSFIVTVYNPLSKPIDKVVRFPVTGSAYTVQDSNGTLLVAELVPLPDPVQNIPGRSTNASVDLVFQSEIPALGFKSFYVQRKTDNRITKAENVWSEKPHVKANYDNASFIYSPDTGLVTAINIFGEELKLDQTFMYYDGFVGDNRESDNRSSGAYVFRPTADGVVPIANKVNFTVYLGDVISELHQTFNEWISQVVRVNSRDAYIEFDWLVGPIPTDDPNGKEVITKFTSQLQTNSTFYTDSNGRQLMQRIRNFRPTWKLSLNETIAGNYYPVTSKIALRDTQQDLALVVLTDRAQGGSSLTDGEIELMVHRNCLHDDAFGVGEALNETAYGKGLVARGSHYVTFGQVATEKSTVTYLAKDIAQRKLLDSWTFLSSTNGLSFEDYQSNFTMEYSGLNQALPENVQILTLEPWQGFTFLLRLEHVYEKDEDPLYSHEAIVNLKDLFTPFEIVSVKETTLGANQWKESNTRLKFETKGTLQDKLLEDYFVNVLYREDPFHKKNLKREVVINAHDADDLNVVLQPMEIRTFVIEISKR